MLLKTRMCYTIVVTNFKYYLNSNVYTLQLYSLEQLKIVFIHFCFIFIIQDLFTRRCYTAVDICDGS